MMKIELLSESDLLFGGDGPFIDPKVGMLCYGPAGFDANKPESKIVIRAGAIGTSESLQQLRSFLTRLHQRIPASDQSENYPWIIDFPGLNTEGPLHFDIQLDESSIERISSSEEEEIVSNEVRKTRIEKLVNICEKKFENLDSSHQTPMILFLTISQKIMNACKDPFYSQDKIIYARRTLNPKTTNGEIPLFDFHHVMKVISFKFKFPIQLIRPNTLRFSEGLQDHSTIAWNFAVACYYKATGTPWKLASLNRETCYCGISFFTGISEGNPSLQTSMAQVYMRTGESQVILGRPFNWDPHQGRTPTLSSDHAKEICENVINLYQDNWGKMPTRLVIHKTSPFTKDEENGILSGASKVDVIDMVHIRGGTSLRVFHLNTGYPPLRGLLMSQNGHTEGLLYTVGFVPVHQTYQGSSIPEPIVIDIKSAKSDMRTIADDIIALTRLDWNNANYCTRLPVTIGVSRKVGNILSEMRARKVDCPRSYRFYM